MEPGLLTGSGILLMFVLGLRHGLDPDHIAIIDGMVYRALAERPRTARWVGTLFALGHGLAVTAIAMGIGAIAGRLTLPPALAEVLDWLPIALLIVVGTLNLRMLLTHREYRAVGWKTWLIPKTLRESSHPAAIFAVGVVFALVFDTATQASAWGYAATAQGGMFMTLSIGLAFTVGMVITDTIDGRLMTRLLQRLGTRDDAMRYRRAIGWIVVALSYGVAAYSILSHFHPTLELDELAFTLVGLALLLMLAVTCLASFMRSHCYPSIRSKT